MNMFNKKEKQDAKKACEAEEQEKRYDCPVGGKALEEIFSDCYDFEKRTLAIGGDKGFPVTLCFVDGLVSGDSIAEQVIRPLTDDRRFGDVSSEREAIELSLGGLTYGHTAKRRDKMDDVISDLLNGFCALVFEREKTAVTFEIRSQEKRAIDQPKEEKIVKASKDSFIEILKTNTMLIRKKIKNPDLKIRTVTVGEKTQTDVAIVYISGFTNMNMVNEVEKRIENIDSEGIITAAFIEENIIDAPKSPFPQVLNTERPDKFCLNLLEGRVGILVDGLPIGFLAPGTFSQFMKAPDDLANHFVVASALTILRYLALIIALLLPAFYVAVAMYHQEMVPTKLMQSIIEAKQAVPFPSAFEVLAMLIAFELLQEAGLRLPNQIGETVSIIGALVVGQSAVEAKVVSPAVVIVIALAGIAGYTAPNQEFGSAIRICRFILVLLAIWAGIFGLAVGGALIIYHLCSLESYGVAYMTPFSGKIKVSIWKALVRKPARNLKIKDVTLKTEDK